MVYTTEKAMEDLKDKVSDADKDRLKAEIAAVNAVKDGDDIEAIKGATDSLSKVSQEIFGAIYQQAGGAAGAGADGFDGGSYDAGNDDGTVDADYEVVDDDE